MKAQHRKRRRPWEWIGDAIGAVFAALVEAITDGIEGLLWK